MTPLLMSVCPLLMGLLIFFLGRNPKVGRTLLVLTALLHNLGTVFLVLRPETRCLGNGEWLAVNDDLTLVVIAVTSFLFLVSAIYATMFLPAEHAFEHAPGNMPEHVFCAILPTFLATMTLVAVSQNVGLLWVAVEATTLASAPLVCYHRSQGALEATWKYLLICSVGIALALFGTFLLGIALQLPDETTHLSMNFNSLATLKEHFDVTWFKAAFLFCLAGYGLKMGLAPFHIWLPDAHSEAPAMVSLLLSGSLLNCSFLAITRVMDVAPLQLRPFCNQMLVVFGMISLVISAVFIVKQKDFKRMLAYSSVEHMGIIAITWGLGLADVTPFHVIGHSLCKMTLFLLAGNFLFAYGTRQIDRVKGSFAIMPRTSFCWMFAVLMICAMPPSPLFYTEFALVAAAGPWLGTAILALLFVIFCGMTHAAMNMTMDKAEGNQPDIHIAKTADRLSYVPTCTLAIVLAFGVALICLLVSK